MVSGAPVHPHRFRSLQSLLLSRDQILWSSVAQSSRTTYMSGIRRWISFTASLGADPRLTHPPAEWSTLQLSDSSLFSRPWNESCVTLFLVSLCDGDAGVIPGTAFSYLSAVRFFLLNSGVDVSFLSSPFIQSTKSGLVHVWRARPDTSVASRRCQPISLDLLLRIRSLLGSSLSPTDALFYSAIIFAFATASRVSEYLPLSRHSWSHAVLSDDVSFAIPNPSAPDSPPILIPSHSCRRIPFSRVSGVLILIRGAKNDPTGVGHRYFFPRRDVAPPLRCFDITSDLWSYCLCLTPSIHQPFFLPPPLTFRC